MPEVDLSQLGMSDFTPYLVERNFAWVLLPLLSFILVLWHLKKHTSPTQHRGDNTGDPYAGDEQSPGTPYDGPMA